MEKIKSLEQLSAMISARWKRGVVTNAAFSPESYRREIQSGTLYAIQSPDGLLLLRKRDGFYRLNFYLQPDADLSSCQLPDQTVLEIAARPKDIALKESEGLWARFGFQQLFSRQRMRWNGDGVSLPHAGMVIRVAEQADAAYAMDQMHLSFDPKTACLPTSEELAEDIAQGNLLLAQTEDGERMGVLRVQRKGRVTEVRQVLVSQNHRKKGVAAALLTELAGACQIWVRTNNLPAMNLYNKLGFTTDGWTSTVWVYDNH